MKDALIVIIISLMVLIACTVLWNREAFLQDPKNSHWWSLSFVSNENAFTVSNFGETRTFSYSVTVGGEVTASGSFTEENGQQQTIPVGDTDAKPLRITVWVAGDENKTSKDWTRRKEIYRR